jgi:hypothetical protein
MRSAALQVSSAQQGSVASPQLPQTRLEVHPSPVSQVWFAQQASPAPPHAAQIVLVTVAVQTRPEALQVRPAQQGSPTAPHTTHAGEAPPVQLRPVSQFVSQHRSPAAPQLAQLPAVQMP